MKQYSVLSNDGVFADETGNISSGYLSIVSSATPVTLTSLSPRLIIVSGSAAQTINLPVTSTLNLGRSFTIINTSSNTTTVQSSGGNAMPLSIQTATSCNLYCILTSGTTASSWQQEFTGSNSRVGNGSLVYSNLPQIYLPSYTVSSTFTAGTNAQGQGVILFDVTTVTFTPNNPSGVTLVSAGGGSVASRHITIINKGTNPINVYPASGSMIDSLGVNNPYQIPVNGVMVFRSVSSTQWYSDFDGKNTGDLNENNVYLSHEFLALNGNDFIGISTINSGTFTQSTANLTVNNPGIARVTSSTTANSGAAARSFSIVYILKGGEVFTEIINPLTFTNTTHRAGLHDSASSAIPANGVYFEYSGSGELTFVTRNNNVPTTSTTIATLAINTWYKVRFTVNSTATSVLAELFNASGVLIASVTQTTNIPTTARLLNVCSITTNSGTTATALIDLDFMSLKTTLTR